VLRHVSTLQGHHPDIHLCLRLKKDKFNVRGTVHR